MATTADLSGDGGDDDQRDSEVSVCPPMMTRDSSGPTVEGENTPRSESTPSEVGRTPRGSFLPKLKLTPRGRRSTLGDGKDRRGTGSSDSGKPSVATLAAGVLDAVGDVAELAAENAVNITATLRNDLEGVTEVLENHLEFPFLAADTHPMHGLQDWSTAEWAAQIEQHPELSALLAQVGGRVRVRVSPNQAHPYPQVSVRVNPNANANANPNPNPDTPRWRAR